MVSYLWRGEFFGTFGEVVGIASGLSNQKESVIPIMEPVVYRNMKSAGEEFISYTSGYKSLDAAILDWTRQSVVVFSQSEKLVKNNMNTPGLDYNFEFKKRRITTLEREFRREMSTKSKKDYRETAHSIETKRQRYYKKLKDAFYYGDEETIARAYYLALNAIMHENERHIPDVEARVKYAQKALEMSMSYTNPVDLKAEPEAGASVSLRDQFYAFLSDENKMLAYTLENDWNMMYERYEKVIKDTKWRTQLSIYPYPISEKTRQKRFKSPLLSKRVF